MHVSVAALLAAALAASAPGAGGAPAGSDVRGVHVPGEVVAQAAAPAQGDELAAGAIPGDLTDAVLGALPPPPNIVVRETKYFGAITIDHRAHLGRRIACRRCHGTGQVSKIEFTPKLAHERCLGCHKEVAKGPEKCQGCHVKPPPPVEEVAAAGRAAEPQGPPPPNPANVAAALAAFDTPTSPPAPVELFQRHIEVGLAAGTGMGLSVRLASHQDFWVVTESVEELRAQRDARTLALVGGGLCRALNPGTLLELSAVGGFDVFDRPVVAVFPALGLRTALEWRQPVPFLQHVTASITGVADLSRRAFGREVGGFAVYGTVATGFRIP